MRLLLGALILLALFSAAALWQRSWTAEARSSRESFSDSRKESGPAVPEDGWSRVVLGRPSGGEPYSRPPDQAPRAGTSAGTLEPPPEGARANGPDPGLGKPATKPVVPAADATVTVQAGQTLSEICHDHYGTARLELVLSVAKYNQLTGPDEIREGQQILLPSLERLGDRR